MEGELYLAGRFEGRRGELCLAGRQEGMKRKSMGGGAEKKPYMAIARFTRGHYKSED